MDIYCGTGVWYTTALPILRHILAENATCDMHTYGIPNGLLYTIITKITRSTDALHIAILLKLNIKLEPRWDHQVQGMHCDVCFVIVPSPPKP